ncbi:MAG: ABC transporter substrate-binding protein, partial [Lachnospiraceae bacterium]|nr:ABC transporter substrate-binding protein [Lachnospiraceae bacterium]
DPDQGVLAAEELVKTYSAIGCIYDTSDDYSAGIYEAFAAKMQELGKAFETRTFDQDNKTDFSSQVEALKGCDAIFLPIYYQEAGLIARACAGKGLTNIALFGCDGLDGVAGEIDATVTNKISYITPFDVNSTEKNVADFVKNYEKKYNVKPDQFAADGYDAIYAIFNAMKSAGVNDVNIKAADLCAKIIPAITADSFSYTGVTGQMSWDATGACEKAPIIVEVER